MTGKKRYRTDFSTALRTIGLSGQGGGAMAEWCDILFPAPSKETFLIQEFHLPLYHTLCLMIEEELYGAG